MTSQTVQASTFTKPSALLITAWGLLLLASGLPRIILQELFDYQVSGNLGSGIAAVVVLVGLALTFVWSTVRALRPFFVLFLVLVGAEWMIFTVIAGLPV